MNTDPTNSFKRRCSILAKNRSLCRSIQSDYSNREMPVNGLLAYLLDAMCLPFHVILRGYMGRNYLTFFKILASSLFFFFCLCMIQFRFETGVYMSPFTPGGFRLIPEIILPASFGEFFKNVRLSWEIWMQTFTPSRSKVMQDFHSPGGIVFKIICIYYIVANFRLWGRKLGERIEDRVNIDSSGEPKIFGFLPIWRWFYGIGYALNFKTDIVKQYVEPLILFVGAQYLLSPGRPEFMVFPGICCYFGAICLALQAYVRSLPARREADNMLRAKFRSQARDTQMELFDLYSYGSPTGLGNLGAETRQPRRR
jgi:hypothetical protein